MDIKEYKEKDKLGGWSGEPVQDGAMVNYSGTKKRGFCCQQEKKVRERNLGWSEERQNG